jgi:hypothetical protein
VNIGCGRGGEVRDPAVVRLDEKLRRRVGRSLIVDERDVDRKARRVAIEKDKRTALSQRVREMGSYRAWWLAR